MRYIKKYIKPPKVELKKEKIVKIVKVEKKERSFQKDLWNFKKVESLLVNAYNVLIEAHLECSKIRHHYKGLNVTTIQEMIDRLRSLHFYIHQNIIKGNRSLISKKDEINRIKQMKNTPMYLDAQEYFKEDEDIDVFEDFHKKTKPLSLRKRKFDKVDDCKEDDEDFDSDDEDIYSDDDDFDQNADFTEDDENLYSDDENFTEDDEDFYSDDEDLLEVADFKEDDESFYSEDDFLEENYFKENYFKENYFYGDTEILYPEEDDF